MSSTVLLTPKPAGSVTVKRNSPVVLCASMGKVHKSTAVIRAFFIFNLSPNLDGCFGWDSEVLRPSTLKFRFWPFCSVFIFQAHAGSSLGSSRKKRSKNLEQKREE